ncbi:MAG: LysM peptidoglycan-binding domain-containing protein [Balneolaceae bacterium]|nr:MAG: LysM peptidoglycan-binding domain-containing protein [Balneolaceae bacterium]
MKQLFLLLSILLFGTSVFAQQTESTEVEMPPMLLPYTNPLLESRSQLQVIDQPAISMEMDTEILRRISNVYRLHVLAIDAQVQGDLVQAENYINQSFGAIQTLLDEYPEIQYSRRFAELYRSVMAEHSEFYGITEVRSETEGDIFEIQSELFSDQDDWIAEGFVLPENLTINNTDVPLIQNQHVNRMLMYYTVRRPDVMERWLERSEYYFPMMREIFEEEGTPLELIHLSMIESGLVPTARSWASAVGLWQFIQATGRFYGLDVNWWVDERRDPIKSTRAAAQHLRDLYDVWGDWHLALANYNLSPRGLRRAINAAGGVQDYWVAFPYLPRETRGYVPSYIAATMIAMSPEEFGFERPRNGVAYEFDIAEVAGLMPLEDLADAAGITLQELRSLNPELLRWATPPGESYQLKIPKGTLDEFLAAYKEIPKENRAQNIAMHTVSRGESLGVIAQRYGTTVRALYESNEGLSNIIHPGQRIVVPVQASSARQVASAGSSSNQPQRASTSSNRQTQQVQAPSNTTSVTYTVKSGDTIGHIAEWFDVRAWQIRNWNGIGNTIRVGQRLTIHVPSNRADYYRQVNGLTFAQKQELERRQRAGEDIFALRFDGSSSGSNGTIRYTVRRNDTLIGIANRHGVSVADIQRDNNISGSRIYAGQTLTIRRR